jgi:ATP-dependent DNA ligase
MLADQAAEPFDSPNWCYELRWGGVRALAIVRNGVVTLRGQNGVDLTSSYPELASLAERVQAHTAVLDGEIVARGPEGNPNLELLRPRLNQLLGNREARLPKADVSYQVSDLLELDGALLLDLPLWQRRTLLQARFTPGERAQISDVVEDAGLLLFDAVCEHGLDGIVAKRKDSPYLPGVRSDDWLEMPAVEVTSFVIGGYTFGGGLRKAPFEALLLGRYYQGRLYYAGRATAGMATAEGWRIVRLLEGLHTAECPFADPPEPGRFIHWCRPLLVCQARVGERGEDGLPRFAAFIALRPDIAPEECWG